MFASINFIDGPRETPAYEVGAIIETSQDGGRFVRVTGKEDNVKNGYPGFEGVEIDRHGNEIVSVHCPDAGVWGYDDQIIRVLRSA